MTDKTPIDQSPEGLDRRTMLKRGAVVGGALVWATPVVQSLAGPAFAQQTSPVTQGCIGGSLTDRYFVKIDSDFSLQPTPGTGGCSPDSYTGSEKTVLPAGVSGTFSGNTATITLPAGFTLIDPEVKVGKSNGNPDPDVVAGCVKDEFVTFTYVSGPNGSTIYTVTVGSTPGTPNADISNVGIIFTGCPPLR